MSNTITNGSRVALHYTGTLTDGEVFDSSRERGEPLNVVTGVGQLIPGMDAALDGMTEGDTKTFTVTPEEGYGERITEAKTEIPRTAFPEDMDLNEGMVMPLNGPDGNILATVETITDTMVAFDLNHPLAGKDLTFDVEVLSVENA